MPLIEKRAASLSDVLRATRQIARGWTAKPSDPEELWFRGQPKRKYPLLPGLYRPKNAPFHYNEESLFERFIARGRPFAASGINSDWDWYFLAQHHGLITRLLDWTSNLFAATYFAISGENETADRRPHDHALASPRNPPVFDDDSPTVWILDAGSLNAFACNNASEDCVFVPGGDTTCKYLPRALESDRTTTNRYPLALLPPYTNVRLAAQQGVFTIHGHDPEPLQSFLNTPAKCQIRLARIVLDRANTAHLWAELELAGVNRLTLFPDLDSVSYITKWTGQYA